MQPGRLRAVLEDWTPPRASIYALSPSGPAPRRTRAFIELLVTTLAQTPPFLVR